jgi:DNA polymerase-3 subunit epsilon
LIHVIDFEGSARTGVVESGVVSLYDGEVVGTQTALFASRTKISAIETQCHGLLDKDLKGLPLFETAWDDWVALRRGGVLAAHNATVEFNLLRGTWPRPPAVPSWSTEGTLVAEWGPWIDTCRLARAWMPSLGDYRLASLIETLQLGARLEVLAQQHCPASRRRYHCALFDALAAALVLKTLGGLEGRSKAPLEQLIRDSLAGPAADDWQQGELEL